MLKKLFSIIIALGTVINLGALVVSADTASYAPPPNVYVRNVLVSQNAYKAGDTVSGTFLFINSDEVSVSDIIYKISLTGGYDKYGKIPVVYDTKDYPAQFLDAHQQKLITFSYKLPGAWSGTNLDIHIQAFQTTGTPLGWADATINVTNGLPTLNIDNAALKINNQEFRVDIGPMVYQNTATATVALTLSNPNKDTITVTPHIKIFDRTSAGAPLKEYSENAVTLKSKASVNLTYQLDTFNNKAGVYLGQIDFLDSNNVARAFQLQYRYIVAGNIITLQSVSTTKTTAAKGDTIPVVINYTGAPYDVVTGATGGNGSATLDVKLFNEKDEAVGTYSDTTDFNVGLTKTVNITAAVPAQALRAEVTATQDGKIVASLKTKLSGNYDDVKKSAIMTPDMSRIQGLSVGIVAIIILVVLILIGIKFVSMRKANTLVALLAISATCFMLFASNADAYVVTTRKSINSVWDYTGVTAVGGTHWIGPSYDFAGAGSGNGIYPLNDGRTVNPASPTGSLPQGYTGTDGSHWHITGCESGTCIDFTPQLTINSPATTDTVAPGSTFHVTGIAYAPACNNNIQDINVSMTFQGTTWSNLFTDTNDATKTNHYQVTGDTGTFSSGNFTAPSTPGTYQLTFRIDNYRNIPGRTFNAGAYTNGTSRTTAHPGQTLDPATTGGYIMGYINIVVGAAAPTVSITASPNPIDYSNASTLSWSTTNSPTSCVASDGWSGSVATAGGTQSTGPLSVSTRYTITCTNAAGSASASVLVTVNQCPACPTATPTSTPTPSDTPSDTPTDSPSDSPSDTNNPSGSPSGSPAFNDLQTSIHHLTTVAGALLAQADPCCGGGDTPPPTVTLYSNVPGGTLLAYNTSPTLTWYANNADSCTSSDFATGNAIQGSAQPGALTNPPTASKTYHITCLQVSTGATISAQTTVGVATQQVTVSATCAPSIPGHPNAQKAVVGTPITWTATVTSPASYTLSWSGDGPDENTPLTGTTNPIVVTYSTTSPGLKNVRVTVTPVPSSSGSPQTFKCFSDPGFPVGPAPKESEV